MSLGERDYHRVYTYKDYLSWSDVEETWEIINGIPQLMTPAPSRRHQEISGQLHTALNNALGSTGCKTFSAPFDVRLKTTDEQEAINVVQPDISVICDASKLDEKGCNGAPDLIVEILSSSTLERDRKDKYLLYQKYGVQEYWLVDPNFESVEVYVLDTDQYVIHDVYTIQNKEEQSVKSKRFNEVQIPLQYIFMK